MTDQNQPRIAINSLSISTIACGQTCEIEALHSTDPAVPGGVVLRFHRLSPDDVPAMILTIARALRDAAPVSRTEVNSFVLGEYVAPAALVAPAAPAAPAAPQQAPPAKRAELPPVAAVVGHAPTPPAVVANVVKHSDDPPADDDAISVDPAPVTGLGTSAPAPSKPKRTRTRKEATPGQAAPAPAPPAPPAEDLDEVHPDEETEGALAVGRDPAGLKGAPQPAATAHEELGQVDEIDEDLDDRAPDGFVTLFPGKHASIERVKGYEKFYDVVQYTMNLLGGPKRNLTLAQLVKGLEVLHPHSAVLQRAGIGDELQRRVETALSSREITIRGMSGS